MLAPADFESRFFAALAALASLLGHAALLVLFVSAPAAEPARTDVVLQIVAPPSAVDEAEPSAVEQAPPTDEGPPPADLAPPAEPDGAPADDYRERLRQRERRFQADMAARRRRVAALDRFHARAAPAAPVEGDVVHACEASAPGEVVPLAAVRGMARYADLVPVGLFPPRYLDEVKQVARARGAARGTIEMALPAREVIVQLDEPAGALFAVGRRDATCLVGFSWSRDVFPLRFRDLPARFVAADDSVREVVMDVVLHADGRFDVTVTGGDALPFTAGALYDQDTVARNLQQRATGARLVRDLLRGLLQ